MKKKIKKLALLSFVLLIGGLFIEAVSKSQVLREMYQPTQLPSEANFAGEYVPLYMLDVRERFDRELTVNANLHATTELVIKRANRVFPIIEPILKKYGVPDDFKYLAVIESGLVNVTSPSGAKGVWQFMPETAKEMGMEVNEWVDERYDLEKSTELACQYLLKAHEKFGNWTLTAASFNGGMNGVSRQIEAQKVNTYYDLLLYEETSRYVFRILALKEIMQNPKKYGFVLPQAILYTNPKVRKVSVQQNIDDLAAFALEQGVNYKILKLHNPWLRDTKLEVQPNKVYTLVIPTEGYTKP